MRSFARHTTVFALTLLLIEFLDEFVYGAREAAWPIIRDDLGLTYVQVGLLLSLPSVVGSLIEPIIGILGDVGKRRSLILAGGMCFALSMGLVSQSQSFGLLLFSFVLFYPASGAFVSLSQASLMDTDPSRHEQNMARWTLAGSIGVVAGPIILGVAILLGASWRGLFLFFALLTLILLGLAFRFPFSSGKTEEKRANFKQGLLDGLRALRRGEILRWLILLQFSDLMLDVLLGFLALYFVDVVGATPAAAGWAVAVWTGLGLLGGLLLIPLLERMEGLRYLRFSAAIELILFVTFLWTPHFWSKVVLVGFLGLFNAGWYSILKAQLYTAMPGQSGTVMTLDSLFWLVGGLVPMGLGVIAEQFDLQVTMGLLCLGPLALLVGIPRNRPIPLSTS